MPDVIMHCRFATQVLECLDQDICCTIQPELFLQAATGPDVWMFFRFWAPWARKRVNKRSSTMHREKTGAFLTALAEGVRKQSGESQRQLFSLLSGYLCHYCLDQTVHPYINWRAADIAVQRTGKEHARLELALDRHELISWNKSLWDFPITKHLLKVRRLPSALRSPLEAVYEQVYGWKNVWPELQRSIKDQKFFYRIVQDPTGLIRKILHVVDCITGATSFHEMTYAGGGASISDLENDQHHLWRHPMDESISSCQSITELRLQAQTEAAYMISCVWDYLQQRIDLVTLSREIGDRSYHTGFTCDDPRNTLLSSDT